MGATYVDVTVRNPVEAERAWTGRFLVDTGSIHSFVPRDRLATVGIGPFGTQSFEMADGRRVELDLGSARLDFMGNVRVATVVIGDEGAEPLLGLLELEATGMEVDPQHERLKRSRVARRLIGIGPVSPPR